MFSNRLDFDIENIWKSKLLTATKERLYEFVFKVNKLFKDFWQFSLQPYREYSFHSLLAMFFFLQMSMVSMVFKFTIQPESEK